jgi:hypothetical protein
MRHMSRLFGRTSENTTYSGLRTPSGHADAICGHLPDAVPRLGPGQLSLGRGSLG